MEASHPVQTHLNKVMLCNSEELHEHSVGMNGGVGLTWAEVNIKYVYMKQSEGCNNTLG